MRSIRAAEPGRSMMRKTGFVGLLVCLVMGIGTNLRSAVAAEHFHAWKSGAAYDKPILDLDQWVADNFADAPNARKDYWEIERFELDIDRDGVPEVFVTSHRLHGTGGGPYLVFQKRGEFYFYGGRLPGSKETMRVLPSGADGHARIRTFWNDGGRRGTATVWTWDGKAFAQVSAEAIRSGDSGTDEGRRRFEELFREQGIETAGAANGSRPIRSETDSVSAAAGSHR